ncbi:hypothetical protein Lal_00013504 [Lupinus albus]|nr:hypothetical protein Lal_00013504 [Lupinus albus]
MLLRNLDQSEGLCNDKRLTVTKMANHISISPSQYPWSFKLMRRQFSIIVSYAMTIINMVYKEILQNL